ncbi:MAG: exopolygalacturonase [Bacteroidales bacterium]|nr:right-handed parallel beta-helix repeat-containing protein [Bacteroidales bacterium]MCR5715045.1 exopolygalacturonase [Bacteroidales bacterium]
MRKLSLVLMGLCLVAMSATAAKKVQKEVNLFPDGTPIEDWFLDSSVPELSELGKIYSLDDYRIYSDPNQIQTEKIQAVIDQAAENGGGVIVVPEGIYKTGSLFFKQGTRLYLKQGAVLLGSEFIRDFPVVMTRIEGEWCRYFAALINAEGLDGFSITGNGGIIDGNGAPYWQAFRQRRQWNMACTNKDEQRPRLVFMNGCTNVYVANVVFQNSPFWSSHYYKCDHVKIVNVRIFSPVKPIASASADGIDMDVCHHFLIKGCRITVNDDAICFKGGKYPGADTDPNNGPNHSILIEDVLFDNTTGSCMTCGSESIHAYNILMRNCRVEGGGTMLQLKMRPDTAQRYEYITVENMSGFCRNLLGIAPWTQFFDLKGQPDKIPSHANNITLKNINLQCNNFMGVSGSPDYDLTDFAFENINIETNQTNWRRDAFVSYTMKNVVAGGQPQE